MDLYSDVRHHNILYSFSDVIDALRYQGKHPALATNLARNACSISINPPFESAIVITQSSNLSYSVFYGYKFIFCAG